MRRVGVKFGDVVAAYLRETCTSNENTLAAAGSEAMADSGIVVASPEIDAPACHEHAFLQKMVENRYAKIPQVIMPDKANAKRKTLRKGESWKLEDNVLHVPNHWSVIGRLFLAPFLGFGLVLFGVGAGGMMFQIIRGRFAELMSDLPAGLGLAALGALLAVPCWMGVFSWYDAVIDGKKRTVMVAEGAWPWIKRWKEPASSFRAISIEEQDLMTDSDGGGSSVTKQAVQLIRAGAGKKPHVLLHCDSFAEAEALAKVASSLLRVPVEKRKR
jgi:hypothetical protein